MHFQSRKKRRSSILFALAACVSAVCLPGLSVQATEADTPSGEGMVSVAVGYRAETEEDGFSVAVSISNQTDFPADVRISNIQETDGTKLPNEVSFQVDVGDTPDLYFTVDGSPRMLSADVNVTAGETEWSARLQFSDTTQGSQIFYLDSEVLGAGKQVKSAEGTSGSKSGNGTKVDHDDVSLLPGGGTTVVDVPGVPVAAIVGAVLAVAAVSGVVIWQVTKKKKGRDEES